MGKQTTKGRARTISKLKRSNQRRNKLIKKGKIKPNSKSPYVTAQMIKGQQRQEKKERLVKRQKEKEQQQHEDKKHGKHHSEDDDESYEEEMMDEEDAFLLHKLSRGKILGEEGKKKGKKDGIVGDDDDEDELDEMEDAAVKRHEYERKGQKKEKALLPIKTKDGIVNQAMEMPESEEEEEMEEEVAEDEGDQSEDGQNDEGLVLNGATSKSVVSLLAERENALAELKLKVGNLASSFIEAPEERIGQLERLVQMLDHLPVHIKNIGFKLVASTVTELLKDVIPAYKISHHNQDSSEVLQKKDTLKLQKYESAVLQCAKSTLVKLERPIKDSKLVATTTGLHALRCVCDILVAHPQFNYSPNILKLIVPALDNRDDTVRECVKSAIQQVFREDKRGEITVVGCRYIKGYIKTKRYRCKPALIECFLGVRLNYIERALADEQDKKDKMEQLKKNKKREEMSKRERKRQKQLKKVEREMLEARGEEAKDVRNRNYSEVSKIVFEVLFRVIKTVHENRSANKLLPATLGCVSAFCHTINVDFFDDLLKVMSDLVREGGLKHSEQLLCIKTAFDILSGPGEFLTYDPGSFTKALYTFLPKLLNIVSKEDDKDLIQTVCGTIKKMLVVRKRHVSRDIVCAFCRALAYAALNVESPQDTLQLLSCLDEVRCAHLRTFENLLDPEEEQIMPPGAVVGLGIGGDSAVRSFSLLKLQGLTKNPDPAVVKAAKKLLNSK